jgi:small-conductance mechanosensitive channel
MDQIVAWLESHHINEWTVLTTLALLAGATIIILLLGRALKSWLEPAGTRIGLRSESMALFARIISIAFWFIVALLVLDLWGVNVAGLWAVLASTAALIGVGFLATWAMVSNITASLFLTIWRPFYLGDMVELLPENLKGRAVERNLMFTVLREEGGSLLQIPNNLFFQKMFRVGGS